MQARSLLQHPPCGCTPKDAGYTSIADGTCCELSKHMREHNSSDGKSGSGGIAAGGKAASPHEAVAAGQVGQGGQSKVGCCGGDEAGPGRSESRRCAPEPDLLMHDDAGEPECCGP